MNKLKVLHIINSLDIGGAEKLITESLPIFKDKGVNIELLLLKDTDSFFYKTLTDLGITVHSLHSRNIYNPLNIFMLIPYFRYFNVVHAHLFPVQYWVAFAKILSLSKTKLVFTEHNTTNRRWQNKKFRLFDRISYSCFSKIGCITRDVRKAFEEYMPTLKIKSTVINNGINCNTYQTATKLSKAKIYYRLSESDKVVIQVAAFRKQKDQNTLIKAFQYLPENYKLLLVGEGDRKVICEELVKTLNLTNKVFFLGKRADTPNLFKSADLSVLCSHWEGFGLVAVESMAAGTPVLASNVPGLSDVVGNGQLLFNNYDVQKLALKISEILENRELYNSLREYCLKRAKHYDIENMVDKYIEVYEEVVKEQIEIN